MYHLMTMTVLPGVESTEGAAGGPGHRRSGPPRRTAMIAAGAVLAVAVAGTAGWALTRSGSGSPAAQPVTPVVHHVTHPAPGRLHGHVSPAQLRAVALPTFAAMDASLGGWTAKGRVHVKRAPFFGGSGKAPRCAAPFLTHARPLEVTSTKYDRTTASSSGLPARFEAQGEVDVFASAASANSSFARITSAGARSCMRQTFARQLGGHTGRFPVVGERVTLGRLPGSHGVFRLSLVASFVFQGREFAVKMDGLARRVGRSVVSVTMVNAVDTVTMRTELRALQAMVRPVQMRLG
jgi:hypothetical protein